MCSSFGYKRLGKPWDNISDALQAEANFARDLRKLGMRESGDFELLSLA